MNLETAKQILAKSINNLQNRRGQITLEDVEAEVINNACLAILKNNEIHKATEYASIFSTAASNLISKYSQREISNALMGIPQNVQWDGMWDFLRDYFQKNHGIQIDNVEATPTIFYSTKHIRYENGSLITESEVERTININFINDKKEIVVSIEPSLSPKKGYVISKNQSQMQFKGFDPDYLFTVIFDSFDEVETFILEMPNRALKMIYLE